MKVVIIKTFPGGGEVSDKVIESFQSHIRHNEPAADIDFCSAADGEAIPDVMQYDLVVISGGTFDLVTKEPAEWVLRIMDIVRKLHADPAPRPKLLGICWGHQIIQKDLGGQLSALAEGPRIGVEHIPLTAEGEDFFGRKVLRLHKFHKRQVASAAAGFVPLASDNEIFISSSGKMLSLQSHPELSGDISRCIMDHDDSGFYTEKSAGNPKIVLDDKHGPHDGAYVWGRILE